MSAQAPVSPERRKKVLKVLFISLLLDLVCVTLEYNVSHALHTLTFSRYPSPSFFPCFLSSLSSTATSKRSPPRPSSRRSSPDSTRTRTASASRSTIAMISSSLVVRSARCSRSARPLLLLSLEHCQIAMAAGRLCCGPWWATSLRWLCGARRRISEHS